MAQIEHHFGASYSAREIRDGDLVPVGGSNFLDQKMDFAVKADYERFQPLFDTAEQIYKTINKSELQKTLSSRGVAADAKMYAAAFAFNKAFAITYPQASTNTSQRAPMYRNGKTPTLSQVVDGGGAMCAEIALLAHGFLNQIKIPNRYFAGQLLAKREHEFGEAHSFIVLDGRSKPAIYDPSNPTVRENGSAAPSLYSIEKAQLDQLISANGNCIAWVKNAVSGDQLGYGVSNGCNIYPEQILDGPPVSSPVKSPAPASKSRSAVTTARRVTLKP